MIVPITHKLIEWKSIANMSASFVSHRIHIHDVYRPYLVLPYNMSVLGLFL